MKKFPIKEWNGSVNFGTKELVILNEDIMKSPLV